MGVLQKSGRNGSMASAMIADGAPGGGGGRFGATASRLEAIRALFVAEEGAERFPPATRFTIVVGGSALFWAVVVGTAIAIRH
jgi:hypothetical protein